MARIAALKRGVINGKGIRSTYLFGAERIPCDSDLERLCLDYFDRAGATYLGRADVVIEYDHGPKKRRYSPDFEVELYGRRFLVEAKSYMSLASVNLKWRNYNEQAVLKKAVLSDYCEKNGLGCIWFQKHMLKEDPSKYKRPFA